MPEIKMPKLGESVVEGVIGKWLKSVGDRVEVDEPLVEIDTDKVNAEVPSPVAGVVTRIIAVEGESVAVGAPIVEILTDDEVQESGPSKPDAVAGSRPAHRFSPAVRRLATESGIDPVSVKGTGVGGRVTKADMEKAIAERSAAAERSYDAASQQPERTSPVSAEPLVTANGHHGPLEGGDEVLPITRMRRTIADRLVHSTRTVPHAWTTVEVDVTSLVKFRESIKEDFRRREGINLTYLPFVVKAAVEALREYPILNSTWEEDRIVIKRRINIGIAVDLDDGLIVPVIRDADQKSIVGLARAISDIATRARSGALKPDDVAGGTFTINNTGAFGSVLSAPIINSPQAAILSMETITKRPVVIGDAIAIRSMMNLCMSLDHRVLDGAVCGRFLRSVKKRLESYDANTPLY